jgi:hypothetical protein
MFTFTPLTEEEIEMAGLLDEGKYDAVILAATNEISKAGNPMVKLIVRVYGPNYIEKEIWCYLSEKMPRLIKHLCDALGYEDKYRSGSLEPDLFVNQNVTVIVGIQKDKNGEYPPRNVISDFLFKAEAKKNLAFEDKDVPF